MTEENKTPVRCLNCGHEWMTRSSYEWVTCPNCRRKVKVNNYRKEITDKDGNLLGTIEDNLTKKGSFERNEENDRKIWRRD